MGPRRPGGQFEHSVGAPDDARDAPGADRLVQAHDSAVTVDEHGVDGKTHEEHVDAAAGADAETVAGGQLATAHQPDKTAPHAVGYVDVGSHHASIGRLEAPRCAIGHTGMVGAQGDARVSVG